MNWLTEVSARSQDWQSRLEVLQREVRGALSEPGQTLKDVVPGVMMALSTLDDAVAGVRGAAKEVETAARTAPQGVK